MEEQKNSLSVPVAIVLAGILIAGAVLLSNNSPKQDNLGKQIVDNATSDIPFVPVSADDHIVGNISSPVTFTVYSDLECPFCKNFNETTTQIVNSYVKSGKVALVFRNFPLEQLHSKAKSESNAAECAAEVGGNEAFWKYLNKIFEITPSNNRLDPSQLSKTAKDLGLDMTKWTACQSSNKYFDKIDSQIEGGAKMGVNGTPHSVIVTKTALTQTQKESILTLFLKIDPKLISISKDGKIVSISGALPFSAFQKILDIMTK
jgi:protein-disulfide isomerase